MLLLLKLTQDNANLKAEDGYEEGRMTTEGRGGIGQRAMISVRAGYVLTFFFRSIREADPTRDLKCIPKPLPLKIFLF